MDVFVTYPISHFIAELITYFEKLKITYFAIVSCILCPRTFAYFSNPTI